MLRLAENNVGTKTIVIAVSIREMFEDDFLESFGGFLRIFKSKKRVYFKYSIRYRKRIFCDVIYLEWREL